MEHPELAHIGPLDSALRLTLIPESFGDLAGLETLTLHENRIAQQLPEILGFLTDLKWLSLHDNQFTGAGTAPCSAWLASA